VILLLSYAGRVILGVALTALLGRSLTPEAFGFFTLVSTIYLVAQTALDLGSGLIAVRDIGRDPARERPLLEGLMALRQVSGWLLALAVLALAILESDSSRRRVLIGTALSMPMLMPGALAPVFHIRQAQAGAGLVSAGGQVFVLLGAWLLRSRGINDASYAWLLVVRELGAVLILWWLAVGLLGYAPWPGFRRRGFGPFLRSAGVFAGAVLMHELYFHADVFLVRCLAGEAQLGAYGAALRPLNPLLALPLVLGLPFLPVFSASAARERGNFATQVGGAASLFGGIGALAAATGIGLARDVVETLYAGRYLEGDIQVVAAFRWLCVALACACTAAPFTIALLADGLERRLLALCAAGLGLNLVLNVIFVPAYGFVAAAVITAATELLVTLGVAYVFLRRHGFPPLAVPFSVSATLSLAALGATLLLPGPPLARLAWGGALSLAAAAFVVSLPGARRFRHQLGPGRSPDPGRTAAESA
jgi:O-antigen/teichoic acid export membrane protein